MMVAAKLKDGLIFGDVENDEYVYMPAGEIGLKEPQCVYEASGRRHDVDLPEAVRLVRVRSLRPARHPLLGASSC